MRDISNSKRRILFIVPLPPPYAGPEIASEHLINSSLRERFEIICVASNISRKNSQKGKITISSLATFSLLMIRIVYKIITKRPKAVYTLLSQNTSGFIRDSLLVLVIKVFRKKIVLHFHGSNFHNFYNNQPAIFRKYIHFILNLADIIIVQAQWVKDRFKKLVPERKLRVIYNGIPQNMFMEKDLSQKDYADSGINVLYLNHLSVAKGLSVLLKAIQKIIPEYEHINFVLAGSVINNEKNIFFDQEGKRIVFEDVKAMLDDITQNKNFSRRVKFLGEITDMRYKHHLLKTSDIFVLPSFSEGCPTSVLEAMAAGLPIVVTPVGALPEIMKDGENGFFLKMGDSEDLKDKIYSLATNSALRNIMGRNNRRLIQSKLDINIIASQLSAAFQQL